MVSSSSSWSRFILLILVVTFDISDLQGIWTKDSCRVDLCFILDHSGSITSYNWEKVMQYTEDFVADLTVSDQATQPGLVIFATSGELVFPLDEYNGKKSRLILALRSVEYTGGGTRIDAGLYTARTECFEKGNRRDAPDVAVLMTDGMSSFTEADHEARLLREKGVSIVVIGVGSNLNRDLLLAIAESEQNLFLIDDFDKLLEDTSLILGRSCSAVESCSGGQIDGWQQSDFPILLDCPRLSNPIIDEDIFKFECYINYSLPVSNEARFLVQFLHDGVPNDQYSVVLSPPDTSVTLHEYFLRGHMGKYLSCQVETYWSTSPTSVSPPVVSRSYWTGITFSHEVVTVYETDNDNNTKYDNVAIDYVYSSLPILCPRDNNTCHLSLKITSTGSVAVYQRQDNHKGIRRCSYQFSKNDWKRKDSWAYNKKKPLQIIALRKVIPQKLRYGTLTMRTEPNLTTLSTDLPGVALGTEYSPWSGYILPDIKVQMYGGSKRGLCHSITDPHLLTFDGSRYDVFEKDTDGIYYLFKCRKAKLKIQTHIHDLYNVGVALSDAGFITIVTTSHKQPLSCEDTRKRNPTKVTSDGSNTFFLHTSSGVIVKVFHGGHYLSIYLEIPSNLHKQTSGLCGSFDDDPSNDFTVRKKQVTEEEFAKRYRVKTADDSYFNCPNTTLEPPDDFCQCDDTIIGGETSDTTVCGLDDKLLRHMIPSFPVTLLIPRFVLTNNRKRPRTKRDVDDEIYTDNVVDYEPPTVSDSYTPYPGPLPWGTYGITEEMARNHCLDTLSGSPSYKICKSIITEEQTQNILKNCVFDIQVTGDVSFAMDTVSSFQESCRVNMLNEAANYVTDPEDPLSDPSFATIFFSFLNVTCINDCNGHGVCNKGSCLCDTGYLGEDCSLLSGTPPSNVQYLEPMFCDRAERPCRSVRLQADNIVTTSDVFCKVTIKHNNGSLYQMTKKGITQGFGIVTCRLPATEYFTYHISLSNDDKVFKGSDPSAPERIIGDSTQIWDECLEQNVYRYKTDTCVKEGKCYERKPGSIICPPVQHYGPWNHFGSCSKSCDFGIQTRTRMCLKSICDEDLSHTRICNTFSCSVLPEERNKGIVMTINGLSINQVALLEASIKNIILEILNNYSRNNQVELCDSIQSRLKENSSFLLDTFIPGDVKFASGYPQTVSSKAVSVRLLARVNVARVQRVCIVDKDRVRRDVQGDNRDVKGKYLRKALTGLDDEISTITDEDVYIEFEIIDKNPSPSSSVRNIIIIVSSVIGVCVIIVIITVVALYCTKGKRLRLVSSISLRKEKDTIENKQDEIARNDGTVAMSRPNSASHIGIDLSDDIPTENRSRFGYPRTIRSLYPDE